MKKGILTVVAILVLTVSGLALAQIDQGNDMKGGGMMKGDVMGKGMMDGKMMGKHGMMKMMERSVVATSDGGIVVISANKITKYDKDLNLVKEIELNVDIEGMQKMMDNMQKMCPMMGKKSMMDNMEENPPSGNAAGESTSADEHPIHHPENK